MEIIRNLDNVLCENEPQMEDELDLEMHDLLNIYLFK